MIVFWSDHGYRLGEKGTFAKHALWEEATNGPLMFAAPSLPKGKTISQPAEMLSVYPTLLDLCGLPAYKQNEGKSLVPIMSEEVSYDKSMAAITTHGMNNHSVRTERYRYIQYEDGTEELYEHVNDPNEWNNQAANREFIEIKSKLNSYLPKHNQAWNKYSKYEFQPYFVEQKKRHESLPKTERQSSLSE